MASQHHNQDPEYYNYNNHTRPLSMYQFWAIIIAFISLIIFLAIETINRNNQNQILEDKFYESTTGYSNERFIDQYNRGYGNYSLNYHFSRT